LLSTEIATQLGSKSDYPTICHVLTPSHININKATLENNVETTSKHCKKKFLGTCVVKATTKTTTYIPTYYWPKYFIEVVSHGNKYHPTFGNNNTFFDLNRKLAKSLGTVDASEAFQLLALPVVKTAVEQLLQTSFNIDMSQVITIPFVQGFEHKRIRASQSSTQSSYDVHIWPVGLSATMGQHFSVCQKGGFTWPIKGVAMTCPVALSEDAMAYWDTGIIDYSDPQAMASLAIGTIPGSGVATQAMNTFGNMEGRESSKNQGPDVDMPNVSNELKDSLKNCSWPMLGNVEAITNKVVSMTDTQKWQGPYVTPWGMLAPRMSTSTYHSDYAMANAALKFKLLAHELMNTPRGKHERWSLAYPWEGSTTTSSDSIVKGFTGSFNMLSVADRSNGLYLAGDLKLIDLAFGSTIVETMKDALATKRRIYTIWEKVSCTAPVTKTQTTLTTLDGLVSVGVTKYNSCEIAIRHEVYKFVQTKLLRKICDGLDQTVGKPWR